MNKPIKEKEIWKDLVGYNGKYKISNKGRVKRFYKTVVPKILKTPLSNNGYQRFLAYKDNIRKDIFVHQAVANLFCKKKASDLVVNHKDGNKLNCNAQNLEWVTRSENALHSYSNGLQISVKGENHGNSQLTEKDVKLIRRLYDKMSKKVLASFYGITYNHLWHIKNNKKWSHV